MRTERHITEANVTSRPASYGFWRPLRWGPRAALILFFLGTLLPASIAQAGVTTFGIQVKPVIPLKFFDPLTNIGAKPFSATVELEQGFAFGMVVRHGLTKSISLETGINQIRRRYAFGMAIDTANYEISDNMRFTGYEIPVLALVYIRLGERSFMNNAIGFSLDTYPSEVVKVQDKVRGALIRTNWVQAGLVGNIGLEYRTEKSGYFYLGATYHRPFSTMARAQITYFEQSIPYTLFGDIDGTYLTVDLRYFFHEDADKRRMRN